VVKKILLSILVLFFWWSITNKIQATEEQHFQSESFYEDDGALVVDIVIYFLRDPSVLTTDSMSVDYVDKYTIENTNSVDTVQAIQRVTGLTIVQSGATGQQTSIFMRGTNSNHTMVAINGIPIKDNSTTGGLHDLGQDFIKHITGIQIVKGSQGTLFGPNAVGGVINFITTDSYENSISTTIGSNNTKGITLKIHEDIDNHSVSVILDGTKSDGISVYPNGAEKDGYETKNITVNTKSKFDNFDIGTTIVKRNNDSDLDASGADDTDYTANNKMSVYQIYTRIKNALGFSNFTFSRSEYDREYVNGTEIDEYDSNTNTYLFTNTFQFNTFDITPGIEYEQYDGTFNNRGSYTSSVDKEGNNTGTFINGNYIVNDKLLLSAGIRNDESSMFNNYNTYRFGTTYEITDDLKLKGNYSTAVKTPTLYELYGADNFGYSGNSNLQPEESETIDFGFEYQINDKMDMDLVYFTTDLDNMITYGNSTYSNATGTSNRHGAELKMNSSIDENFYVRSGTTFTIAQDSDDKQVTRRPKWNWFTGIDYKKDKVTNTLEWIYTGKHLDIDSQTYATIEKPAVDIINFHTKYEINESSDFILSVNNLTDVDYERPDGYAQDGRNFLLTFKIKY
tara:strand:- start:2783 stop:4651 length:1869 start_codon:yes stop_codon:yes gene_type:complete